MSTQPTPTSSGDDEAARNETRPPAKPYVVDLTKRPKFAVGGHVKAPGGVREFIDQVTGGLYDPGSWVYDDIFLNDGRFYMFPPKDVFGSTSATFDPETLRAAWAKLGDPNPPTWLMPPSELPSGVLEFKGKEYDRDHWSDAMRYAARNLQTSEYHLSLAMRIREMVSRSGARARDAFADINGRLVAFVCNIQHAIRRRFNPTYRTTDDFVKVYFRKIAEGISREVDDQMEDIFLHGDKSPFYRARPGDGPFKFEGSSLPIPAHDPDSPGMPPFPTREEGLRSMESFYEQWVKEQLPKLVSPPAGTEWAFSEEALERLQALPDATLEVNGTFGHDFDTSVLGEARQDCPAQDVHPSDVPDHARDCACKACSAIPEEWKTDGITDQRGCHGLLTTPVENCECPQCVTLRG